MLPASRWFWSHQKPLIQRSPAWFRWYSVQAMQTSTLRHAWIASVNIRIRSMYKCVLTHVKLRKGKEITSGDCQRNSPFNWSVIWRQWMHRGQNCRWDMEPLVRVDEVLPRVGMWTPWSRCAASNVRPNKYDRNTHPWRCLDNLRHKRHTPDFCAIFHMRRKVD